jgi:hypothetical protein
MTGSAATQAPPTLLREPLYFYCTISALIVTQTIKFDHWQTLRVRGVVFWGRPSLTDCKAVQIETSDKTLIAHRDEVECLDLADG